MSVVNRPGLAALHYRIGTHASFFAAMTERLAAADLPGLSGLTARDLADPSIALLDAWATVADILTFYQERIANEGFVRTATERRSIVELGRLIGYALRPGVAAGVYLAYTCEKGADVVIPAGSRAQSIPGDGQTAQSFETSLPLAARYEWNALGIRMSKPQTPAPDRALFLKGTATQIKPNDALLLVDPNPGAQQTYTVAAVAAVELQPNAQRTKVVFQTATVNGPASGDARVGAPDSTLRVNPAPVDASLLDRYTQVRARLRQPPARHPASAARLARSVPTLFGTQSDGIARLIAALHPESAGAIYTALANAPVAAPQPIEVHVFRAHTALFGHNAPRQVTGYAVSESTPPSGQPPDVQRTIAAALGGAARGIETLLLESLQRVIKKSETTTITYGPWELQPQDAGPKIALEARCDRIIPGSYVALRSAAADWNVHRVQAVNDVTRNDYGLSANSTVLDVEPPFALAAQPVFSDLATIDVYAQSERLELVAVPIDDDFPQPLPPADADPDLALRLELDALYAGLAPGRWAIVTGTRTDLPGVADSELVMIASVEHDVNPAYDGDAVHTFITLSHPLQYTYARATVAIYANVVAATQGETRAETIGSGDAATARQRFTLKAKPLTFVSAATPSGVSSTLAVRVNGVRWAQDDAVDALGPTARTFAAQTDEAGATTVIFGDGVHGARLPSGVENITAVYRTGIGVAGNLAAGQIATLNSRPLGVKGVTNPQPSTGGADPESRDAARTNVASALFALDRLVSVSDYADFARTFAGIAKASVTAAGSANAQTVYLTVAGAGDAALDPTGDLSTNLAAALRSYGDPSIAVELASASRIVIVIAARVSLLGAYVWENVAPRIRAALASTFGFAQRDFGQPAYVSEALAAIANVDGVDDVAIDTFEAVHDTSLATDLTTIVSGRHARQTMIAPRLGRLENGVFAPAEIATIDPTLDDAIVLTLMTGTVS